MDPVAFVAPLPSTIYPHLSLVLTAFGLLLMAWFFTMQVSTNGESSKENNESSFSVSLSKLIRELTVALIASSFIGFGLLFLALNVGLYV